MTSNPAVYALAGCLVCGFSLPALGQYLLDGQFPEGFNRTFEQVHAEVSGEFADPRSAQYKGLVEGTARTDGVRYLCGWINWRNEAGGYGPFQGFLFFASDGNPLSNGRQEASFLTRNELGADVGSWDRLPVEFGCPDGF